MICFFAYVNKYIMQCTSIEMEPFIVLVQTHQPLAKGYSDTCNQCELFTPVPSVNGSHMF